MRAGTHQLGSTNMTLLSGRPLVHLKPRHQRPSPTVSLTLCSGIRTHAPVCVQRNEAAHSGSHASARSLVATAAAAVLEAAPAEATATVPVDFPVPRGDTAGAALVVDGVTIQAGDRDLLQVGIAGQLSCTCHIYMPDKKVWLHRHDMGTAVAGLQHTC